MFTVANNLEAMWNRKVRFAAKKYNISAECANAILEYWAAYDYGPVNEVPACYRKMMKQLKQANMTFAQGKEIARDYEVRIA
jgi:hypothetical protein